MRRFRWLRYLTALVFISGCSSSGGVHNVPQTPLGRERTSTSVRSSLAVGESAYPSGAAALLPGTIAFDNYDIGGEGLAYHTQNRANPGGKYRADGVGVENDGDTGYGNGFDVGWNATGNWYRYSVDVQAAGSYPVAYRIAANAPGSMHVEDERGTNLSGPIAIAASGGFQAWTTVRGTLALAAGAHVLKVAIDSGNGSFNLNVMTIGQGAVLATEAAYPSGTPWPVPGTIEFDNYDTGGEGVAYHTHHLTNPGGKYRNDGVGVETDRDPGIGNGFDVGWNDTGNYYKYTLAVQPAGTYPVTVRLAANGAGTFHLEDENGKNLTGTIAVAATGGYQSWINVATSVTLDAGKHVLKIAIDSGNGSFNLNLMTLGTPSTTPSPIASASPTPGPSPSVQPSITPTSGPTPTSGDIDWPTQGFDRARTGENPNEKRLTAGTIGGLKLLWTARIAGDTTSRFANSQPVVASHVVVGGAQTNVVYTGDEHGYFAAFDATSGALIWRKALGSQVTSCPDIPDRTFGITDAATIDHARNRIYVVDGAGKLWALDLATGNVSAGWPAGGLSVVDDPSIDHVYSGLALNSANGMLYVPSASYCDIGRWHGALRAINTQTASIASIYYFATGSTAPPASTGPYGGGVWGWGGIAIDAQTNNVYGASGNTNPQVSAPASNESITEWNASLGLVASAYPPVSNGDLDFGGSTVLYNAGGSPCVIAFRKNGQLFSYNRSNLAAGPATAWQIARDGISSPAFSSATGLIYFNNPNAGALAQGVYALRTLGGCIIDQTPAWSVTGVNANLQAPSIAGGIIYEALGSKIQAYSASSGAPLWTSGSSVTNGIQAAPTIVNGRLYVVDWSDKLYAFGL